MEERYAILKKRGKKGRGKEGKDERMSWFISFFLLYFFFIIPLSILVTIG
jgi:hypothetical protein